MFNVTFKQNFRRSKKSSEKLFKLKHKLVHKEKSYILIVFFPTADTETKTASANAV